MKRIFFTLFLAIASLASAFAQGGIPDQFAFQGTILYNGQPYVTTAAFPVDIEVYFFNSEPAAGSTSGFVFKQLFSNQETNTIGAFSLQINSSGSNVTTSGQWTAINWLSGNIWIVVRAEIQNQAFTEVARFKVLSQPYALYAQNLAGVRLSPASNGQVLAYNGTTSQWEPATKQPQVAILKENKSFSGGAGSVNGGVWFTRALSNLSPLNNGFVTLTGNQFTLQPGKYLIEAEVPGYQLSRHFAVLRRISDNFTEIAGSVGYNGTAFGNQGDSKIVGIVEVLSATTYDIRHIGEGDSPAGQGVGGVNLIANSQYTGDIPFTIVKITKLD